MTATIKIATALKDAIDNDSNRLSTTSDNSLSNKSRDSNGLTVVIATDKGTRDIGIVIAADTAMATFLTYAATVEFTNTLSLAIATCTFSIVMAMAIAT